MSIISTRNVDMNDTHDNVNQPAHYTYADIEILDFIIVLDTAQSPPQLAFAIGNAIKYLSRAPLKSGHEDLAKAKFYVQRAVDLWEG
ncbi:DUF3310 domain-containing protein [Staphylococcus aureus]|uniref:DUF3310 domain-containing protein n=1 Tax=Staphylococcus aureus TaxID=1280 RepID=UPI000851F01B|nr:DUF3310 domain-containing protein [Staphylococcus aureus]